MTNALISAIARGLSPRSKALSTVNSSAGGGWLPIFESFSGAWQSNVEVDRKVVLANAAVFSCMTLISRDIAKLRVKLVQKSGQIWQEATNPAYSPVLRKPNGFQTRNQFWECYFLSKLSRGNTYVLKERDQRGVVTALYVLDPTRVTPLVSDSGQIFYQLSDDNLSKVETQIIVPAREIIHDRWNCLFHPLVGLSPIFANGVAAMQGVTIQENATNFFANQSRPGGILIAPGKIQDDTAKRLKEAFDANYTGANSGKIAVVGDGLQFEQLTVSAVDAQLIEQLKWTAEIVAATFHVPLYKLGMGTMPTNNNVQSLNTEYYSQALQSLIEEAESCLDEGMGMDGWQIGTEFDVDGLLRMDSQTQMQVLKDSGGIMAPNEQRARLDLPPKEGGESPYMQQQNFSLSALARRDALPDPFATTPPAAPPVAPDPAIEEAQQRAFFAETLLSMRKSLEAA